MKINHRDKLKLARKNMSKKEIKDKVSPFSSKWWSDKKEAIVARVKKIEVKQKETSRLRKEKKI